MDVIKIKDNMINILSSIKGDTFLNYECAFEEKWNRTYGYLRITTNNKSIDISNQQNSLSMFNEIEDVSCLEIFVNSNKTLKDTFHLVDDYSSNKYDINEIINKIYVISETVEKNSETTEFDMGFIIETDKHKYCFTKENWFDEFIYINVDKEYDDIYPVEKDIKDWSSDETDEIKIARFIKEI